MTFEQRADNLFNAIAAVMPIAASYGEIRKAREAIADAIRAAVAEQRERDAKIAEQTHAELDAKFSPDGCTDTALEVARRIRETT